MAYASTNFRQLRAITVAGRRFVWRFTWRYDECFASVGTLRAWAVGRKVGGLQVHFRMAYAGGIPQVPGAPSDALSVNLHTPRWAAALIRYALRAGWEPGASSAPFVITDGAAVLAALLEPAAEAGA